MQVQTEGTQKKDRLKWLIKKHKICLQELGKLRMKRPVFTEGGEKGAKAE